MSFHETYVEEFRNASNERAYIDTVIVADPGVSIFKSTFEGPFSALKDTQIGPDVRIGKYSGFNKDCFFARGQMGSFCAVGARVAINPFNHPIDWLSINEFQYHPRSFDWVEEYNAIERLERTPDMFEPVTIGHDVWIGHNANIMPGVTIGTGAVVGAGAIVTKNVPPYAIVAGVPADIIRYRFDTETVKRLLATRWWEFDLSVLSGLPYRDVHRCLEHFEKIRTLS